MVESEDQRRTARAVVQAVVSVGGPPRPTPQLVPSSTAVGTQYEKFDFEILGESPLAVTYRGHDFRLKRDVAIKEYRTTDQESRWERVRESARLAHRHLVSLMDVDPARGWIVMELMAGSIAQECSKGALSEDRVQGVLTAALEGLACIHAEGRLHLALRPCNLLTDRFGNVKLADARWYRFDERLPIATARDWYIAPEVLHPGSFGMPGPGSDLFCLGMVTLQLLAGKSFAKRCGASAGLGRGQVDWVRWIGSANTKFPAALELIPSLSPALAEIIDRMVDKNVQRRYRSATEVLHALSATSNKQPSKQPVKQIAKQPTSAATVNLRPPMDRGVHLVAGPGSQVRSAHHDVDRSAHPGKVDWVELREQLLQRLGAHRSLALVVAGLGLCLLGLAALRPRSAELTIVTAPHAEVQLELESGAASELSVSDSDGQVHFANVPLGHHLVVVSKEGYQQASEEVDLRADANVTIDLLKSLQGLEERTYTVNWEVTVEPAHARIQVESQQNAQPLTPTAVDGGTYRFALDPITIYNVSVSADVGFEEATIAKWSGEDLSRAKSTITLRAKRQVVLQIENEQGEPLSDLTVEVNGKPTTQLDTAHLAYIQPEESVATYRVACAGFRPVIGQIELPDDKRSVTETIKLAKLPIPDAPQLTRSIFTITGKPAGARVTLHKDGQRLKTGRLPLQIDLEHFEPGTYELTSEMQGFDTATEWVEVQPGGSLDISLSPWDLSPAYLER